MNADLPDRLLLLVYDPAGALRVSGQSLDYGLAGAVLMELMLAQRLHVPGKRVVVVDPTPMGEPMVDAALTRIHAAGRQRKPKDWIGPISKGLRQQVLDRQVRAGVLRHEKRRVLGLFPYTRYPWAAGAEPALAAHARREIGAALAATGPVDPRVAALCALVRATRAEAWAVPDLPKRVVRARLKEIVTASWPAEAVRKAITEMEAAVATAASTAAITAATSS